MEKYFEDFNKKCYKGFIKLSEQIKNEIFDNDIKQKNLV